jgi:hypothetical protein
MAANLGARLIALRKPNGGLRPIACGCVLRRLAGRAACEIFGEGIKRGCGRFQYAVGTRAGCEVVHKTLAALTEAFPQGVVLAFDATNAFNSVPRQRILDGAARLAPDLLPTALETLAETGTEVTSTDRGIRVRRNGGGLEALSVETRPFPGFPTDLQAQMMALMTTARGTSVIRETIFENRFMHVQELVRLGAEISLKGDTATIKGVKRLTGAQVMATDLRASVSLVIAGLVADGETMINRVYHLDRGFEKLEQKLSACGAQIERVSGD